MGLFSEKRKHNWSLKEPRPRSDAVFELDLDAVVAEALFASGGKSFSGHDEAQEWYVGWRIKPSASRQRIIKFVENHQLERIALEKHQNEYIQMSIADVEGYIRQFWFRIATTAGVSMTFIAIWFLASWLAAGEISMPGI